MKKRFLFVVYLTSVIFLLAACSSADDAKGDERLTMDERYKVGLMLSDTGLGDLSIGDLTFKGLQKAREDFAISFTYLEPQWVNSYEDGIQQLIDQGNDLIIAVGYMPQEALEKLAQQYPDQQFMILDTVSDVANVSSITFKEDEGSFLAGIVAAKASKTNVIGFLGGEDAPVIRNFESGYIKGAQSVKPDIKVLSQFAETYTDEAKGRSLTRQMVNDNADVLFAAAGLTGVGLLREAQATGHYAIGVDSDQYFIAEKAVITSMMKNLDIAVYEYIAKEIENKGSQFGKDIEMGIKENGVGLAPVRVLPNAAAIEADVDAAKSNF